MRKGVFKKACTLIEQYPKQAGLKTLKLLPASWEQIATSLNRETEHRAMKYDKKLLIVDILAADDTMNRFSHQPSFGALKYSA